MKKIVLLLFLCITAKSFAPNIDAALYDQRSEWQKNQFILINTKNLIEHSLSDVSDFTLKVNNKHLLFMEKQRQYYNIPPAIFYRLLYKESTFREIAFSHVGATGYMQIMPSTFDWVFDNFNLNIVSVNNPYDNIQTGSFLLRYLKDKIDEKYPNNTEEYKWKRVLASYNAGYGRHYRAMYKYSETVDYIDFIIDRSPIKETPIINYDNYLHIGRYI